MPLDRMFLIGNRSHLNTMTSSLWQQYSQLFSADESDVTDHFTHLFIDQLILYLKLNAQYNNGKIHFNESSLRHEATVA